MIYSNWYSKCLKKKNCISPSQNLHWRNHCQYPSIFPWGSPWNGHLQCTNLNVFYSKLFHKTEILLVRVFEHEKNLTRKRSFKSVFHYIFLLLSCQAYVNISNRQPLKNQIFYSEYFFSWRNYILKNIYLCFDKYVCV